MRFQVQGLGCKTQGLGLFAKSMYLIFVLRSLQEEAARVLPSDPTD